MDVWEIVLYGSAAYLTLQLLVRLMDSYRRKRISELTVEYQRQQRQSAAQKTAAAAKLAETLNADRNQAA